MGTTDTPPELRVLVIDDEPDSANSLAYLLQLHGCRTAVAFGGESGLRMLQLFHPELVFLDLRMPDYDGCGLLHRSRAFLGEAAPMFVCLTGDRGEEGRAIASGFDKFVAKPINPTALSAILSEASARAIVRDWKPLAPSAIAAANEGGFDDSAAASSA